MKNYNVPMSWVISKIAHETKKSMFIGTCFGYFVGGVVSCYALLYLLKRGVKNV